MTNWTSSPEALALMEQLKKRFGVATNVEALKCALREGRVPLPPPDRGLKQQLRDPKDCQRAFDVLLKPKPEKPLAP